MVRNFPLSSLILPALLPPLFLIAVPIFSIMARNGYIRWYGYDFTSPQAKQFLQQRRAFMERTNSRLEMMISEGEAARRDGNLPAAEQAFKMVLTSPEVLQFPNERIVQDYVIKARAELAKVQEQEATTLKVKSGKSNVSQH